jgi:putative transposase
MCSQHSGHSQRPDTASTILSFDILRFEELSPIQIQIQGRQGRLRQLTLSFPETRRHGGARAGAGRKRQAHHLRQTPHRKRPKHRAAQPVHITLRAATRSLRHQHVARTVLKALRDSNTEGFRIVHYSVQANHVHLIAEARHAASLSSGVRGLAVRIARHVNRLLFRRGRFWADRWHGRPLTSPREVRNALVYVLQNHRKHARTRPVSSTTSSVIAALDKLSSAEFFAGFAAPLPRLFRALGPPCVVPARTWLLRVGWLRHGRIHFWEMPQPK